MDPTIVAFLGALLGALFRSLIPFLRKLAENPELQWKHQYTVTLMLSFMTSMVFAVLTVCTLDLTNITTAFTAFLLGFTTAYTSNDVANDLIKSKVHLKPIPIPKEEK